MTTLLLEDCNGFTKVVAWGLSPPPFFQVPDKRHALDDFVLSHSKVKEKPIKDTLVFRRVEQCEDDVWLYKEQFT